jgi:hypothetical protein
VGQKIYPTNREFLRKLAKLGDDLPGVVARIENGIAPNMQLFTKYNDRSSTQNINNPFPQSQKILFLPDNNVFGGSNFNEFISCFPEGTTQVEIPKIIQKERRDRIHRFASPENLAEFPLSEVATQKKDLEIICNGIGDKESVEILFNTILEHYLRELDTIKRYSALPSKRGSPASPMTIAEKLAKEKIRIKKDTNTYHMYLAFANKHITTFRSGKIHNPLADIMLTGCCFAYNLIDEHKKAIILSADNDIEYLAQVFDTDILPKYIVRTIEAAISKKCRKLYLNEQRFHKACTSYIEKAGKTWNRNIKSCIIYNPLTQKLMSNSISYTFKRYFSGVDENHPERQNIIEAMLEQRQEPEKIISAIIDINSNH